MNRKLNHIEQIERYLEGNMSGEELQAFEKLLDKDPMLKSEFQLQEDIINAIKESRKAELKARLDNVNVGAYNTGISGAKIVLTGAITAAVGLGVYFYSQENVAESPKQVQEQPVLEDSNVFAQPEESEAEAPAHNEQLDEQILAHHTITEEVVMEEKADETIKAEDPVAVVTTPEVIPPTPIEAFEDTEAVTTEIKTPANKLEESLMNTEVTAVEIENEKDHSNSFHYKFYNNKLYLYGDFKNIPYELIELNTVSGKSVYLYYKGNFYYLASNQIEISPLNQIKDQNLIGELEGLRNK